MSANRLTLACLTTVVVSAVAAPSARWVREGTPIPAERLIRNLEGRFAPIKATPICSST